MSIKDLRAGQLSKYKAELMGVATLGVFLVHSSGWISWPGGLNQLVSYGGVGVYIFAFLSGIGCFYSLEKNDNAMTFYMKRMQRVLLPYALIASIGYLLEYRFIHNDMLQAIQDFSLYSFFFRGGKGGLWYVSFCLIAYLCAPLLFRIRKGGRGYIVILELIITVCIFFFKQDVYVAYHQIMTSLMVFSIGLFYGNTVKEDRGKQQWIPLLILSCFAVKVILPYKLKLEDDLCYSSLGIAVSYCVAIVMSIPQAQRVKKALLFFGGISFEVYVVNHFL